MNWPSRYSFILALLLWQIPVALSAPSLSANWSVTSWPNIVISVSLSNDQPAISHEPLAGLQFDLNYNPSVFQFQGVSAGAAASNQDFASVVNSGGVVKVLFTPKNNDSGNTFADGEIARFSFSKIGGGLSNATISFGDVAMGNEAAVQVIPGVLAGASIVWGPDYDGDGIPNTWDPDGDNDGIPDWYENLHGLNPLNAADANLDPDADGLTNLQEFQHGTNPNNPDTDGDGVSDGDEVAQGRNPKIDDALIPVIMQIINSLILSD
jgi:hypothetical protein